ncbi:MAG: spore coat protein [Ruminiclostridium sp.]|nr:spore coat protein [Ruminiclostridium sp.]
MHTTPNLTEQEIMTDALNTEKLSITSYGTYLAEATCQNLRQELNQIINENQQIQFEIFDNMQKRGWYQPKNAQLNEIQQSVQKHGQMKQSLSS